MRERQRKVYVVAGSDAKDPTPSMDLRSRGGIVEHAIFGEELVDGNVNATESRQ